VAEKIIRDPVHDVIAFGMDRPGEALLFRLINAGEFQRLRRIRQLGLASLAYPGADHTRYSHSLGVMETARKMLEQLRRSTPLDAFDEIACLSASLLHDLGHGPFSHLFERATGVAHEAQTRQIILDDSSQVHRLLAEFDSALPERVAGMLAGQGPALYCDILSGQLDADRLDYLLRDNLMTGSRYGDYDLTWLLHALVADSADDHLAISWKGISAVEAYLQSRYHMYRNVYFHKVVRSAEGMVKLILQRAGRLAVQGRLSWPPRDHVVYKALVGQAMSMSEFIDLDEISIMHCFKLWQDSDDATLAGLCHGVLFRRLFKTIDLSGVAPQISAEALSAARAAVESAGGEGAYDLFYDEPADTALHLPSIFRSEDGSAIRVRQSDGKVVPLATLSPLPHALDRRLTFRRIHVSGNFRDVVAKAIARFTGG
jgi:HD superfamily phosphohydrolase